MRHILVASCMLVFGLVVTFGAASVLQATAIAHANKSAEPFVIEAAREPAKPFGKVRVTPVSSRSGEQARLVRVSG